jgi:hypothetical protein
MKNAEMVPETLLGYRSSSHQELHVVQKDSPQKRTAFNELHQILSATCNGAGPENMA